MRCCASSRTRHRCSPATWSTRSGTPTGAGTGTGTFQYAILIYVIAGTPITQNLCHSRTDLAAALGYLDAELGQQSADLVDVRRAGAHRPGPHPVDGLLGLPVRTRDPHAPHAGTLDRFTQGRSVNPIVCVGLQRA